MTGPGEKAFQRGAEALFLVFGAIFADFVPDVPLTWRKNDFIGTAANPYATRVSGFLFQMFQMFHCFTTYTREQI